MDSLEDITDCMRTTEFHDRNPMYHWFQKALDFKPIEIRDFSRVNFENTVLGKRKITALINDGLIEDWSDKF